MRIPFTIPPKKPLFLPVSIVYYGQPVHLVVPTRPSFLAP